MYIYYALPYRSLALFLDTLQATGGSHRMTFIMLSAQRYPAVQDGGEVDFVPAFLRLPTELRLNIYEFVFPASKRTTAARQPVQWSEVVPLPLFGAGLSGPFRSVTLAITSWNLEA